MTDIAIWTITPEHELEGVSIPSSTCSDKHSVLQELIIRLLTPPGSCFADPTIGCSFINDWTNGLVEASFLPHILQIHLAIIRMQLNSLFPDPDTQIDELDLADISIDNNILTIRVQISFKDGETLSARLRMER